MVYGMDEIAIVRQPHKDFAYYKERRQTDLPAEFASRIPVKIPEALIKMKGVNMVCRCDALLLFHL